jgi:hypothetical protein
MRRRAIFFGQPAGVLVAVAGPAATSASRPVPISAIRSPPTSTEASDTRCKSALTAFRFTPVEELPAILQALSV